MTAQEKLEGIKRNAPKLIYCEIEWMIARIEKLTETLEVIKSLYKEVESFEHVSCSIARKALEE